MIQNEDNLLRRIPKGVPNYIKEDGSIKSFSFQLKNKETGISVDVESLTNHKKAVLDANRFGLLILNTGYVRSIGLDAIEDEQPDNNAHALIIGAEKKESQRKLALHAERIPQST